jgi:hypothetical protein
VEREDPVMAICDPCGGDVGAAMTSLGYEAWCQVGVGEWPPAPVSMALYSREAAPLQFLLQLEGNAGNIVEHVFAETLPDAMDLLARWVPVACPAVRSGEPAGEGRSESPSGRPVDGSGHAEDARGRPGERPGRPQGLGGDRPTRPISPTPLAPPG